MAGSFLTWNNSYSVEPRFSIKYELSNKTVFTAAYGLHAKMLPIGVYLLTINGSQPNKNLKMVKSHHAVLGFEQLLGKYLKLGVELYFQQMITIFRRKAGRWITLMNPYVIGSAPGAGEKLEKICLNNKSF